jgi:hypothetical protein
VVHGVGSCVWKPSGRGDLEPKLEQFPVPSTDKRNLMGVTLKNIDDHVLWSTKLEPSSSECRSQHIDGLEGDYALDSDFSSACDNNNVVVIAAETMNGLMASSQVSCTGRYIGGPGVTACP